MINYQRYAMRTNDQLSRIRFTGVDMQYIDIDLYQVMNGCLGLSGEVGEFNDEVKKMLFHDKPMDESHLQKELGDILWYIALICDAFEWSMNDIMRMNIRKLQERYPEGFDTDKSNNRKENDI